MTAMSDRLLQRFYKDVPHPYRLFERKVDGVVAGGARVLLDAGCGRSVPVLRKYLGRVDRLIGVELVEFTDVPSGIETYNVNLGELPLEDSSVDAIMSRSVFEHLTDPGAVYREFARVLRPGGRVVFLTANMWDYGTLVARLVPNHMHGRIVKAVEGREEEDTFPTAYKTNTRADVDRLAAAADLRVEGFEYLSQYPNYLMFNGLLFLIGTAFEKLISRYDALRILRGWILVTLVKPAQATSR
jgi:SAM-dependent methyltransferase